MGFVLIILAALAAWYFGFFESLQPYTYRAEVGYYQNGQQTWYVGGDKSYDGCMSEARGLFNNYNATSRDRAFSWACRKMQGERFLARVR